MNARLSETELQGRLSEAASAVQIGGRYRHYKGSMYRVVALALIEATNEPAVVYKALYGEQLQFIRPIGDWCMMLEWEGRSVPRFKLAD